MKPNMEGASISVWDSDSDEDYTDQRLSLRERVMAKIRTPDAHLNKQQNSSLSVKRARSTSCSETESKNVEAHEDTDEDTCELLSSSESSLFSSKRARSMSDSETESKNVEAYEDTDEDTCELPSLASIIGWPEKPKNGKRKNIEHYTFTNRIHSENDRKSLELSFSGDKIQAQKDISSENLTTKQDVQNNSGVSHDDTQSDGGQNEMPRLLTREDVCAYLGRVQIAKTITVKRIPRPRKVQSLEEMQPKNSGFKRIKTSQGISKMTICNGSRLHLSVNFLAVRLYKLLIKDDGNVFFSSLSLSSALAMVLCGADGETADEMSTALGFTAAGMSLADISHQFQELLSEMEESTRPYQLTCANAVLCDSGILINKDYKRLLTHSFRAFLQEVNFKTDSEVAIRRINEWAKEQTRGRIPSVLQSLPPFSHLVVANAVFFKGDWQIPFLNWKTRKQTFYNKGLESCATEVDMMQCLRYAPYLEKDNFRALKMPYEGDDIAMYVLLPKTLDGLAGLESMLSTSFIWDIDAEMQQQQLSISMPKFKLEYSAEMVDCFEDLGMRRAFRLTDDFHHISTADKLCISGIMHKSSLEINEQGTVAAAATGFSICGGGYLDIPHFQVDHPFTFAIYDKSKEIILFMGRVNEL